MSKKTGVMAGKGANETMKPPEGFSYIPELFTDDEQRALLQKLQGLDYRHDTIRGQQLKRAHADFGHWYIPSGRKLEPAPQMPEFLTDVILKCLPYCPERAQFDQCIVTYYPAKAGINWHTDAMRFGDCIMGVSLAAKARLQFRPNQCTEVTYEELALPGSLYVMLGTARWDFQHQVVPVKSERYSLTFRHVPAQSAGA